MQWGREERLEGKEFNSIFNYTIDQDIRSKWKFYFQTDTTKNKKHDLKWIWKNVNYETTCYERLWRMTGPRPILQTWESRRKGWILIEKDTVEKKWCSSRWAMWKTWSSTDSILCWSAPCVTGWDGRASCEPKKMSVQWGSKMISNIYKVSLAQTKWIGGWIGWTLGYSRPPGRIKTANAMMTRLTISLAWMYW